MDNGTTTAPGQEVREVPVAIGTLAQSEADEAQQRLVDAAQALEGAILELGVCAGQRGLSTLRHLMGAWENIDVVRSQFECSLGYAIEAVAGVQE